MKPSHTPLSLAPTTTLEDCQALDALDPLRPLQDLFTLPAGVYLDGNSLGAMPRATPARVAHTLQTEWGQDLIQSWNKAGWFDLPRRVGDKVARLIGADPGTVVAADSTSINLYKVLSAALNIAASDAPQRRQVLSERSNFPTDLYIAEALCRERGLELVLVEAGQLEAALTPQVAVLMLTHVNYRSGAMHPMARLSAAAHAAGALVVWDLAHSAGAVPLQLTADGADFAVGCGYKYLNGGPGAPAFVWVHPRHSDRCWQPLAGWWGHAKPFAFTPDYQPASGIARYQCGTQPMLSLVALDCGLDSVLAAEPLGGMAALRAKSLALSDQFIAGVARRCAGFGLHLVSPLAHAERGSQLSYRTELPGANGQGSAAYALMQALIARGVVGDFRAGDGAGEPDLLRFGFTPLYLSHAAVWQAVEALHAVLHSGEWRQARFQTAQAVT